MNPELEHGTICGQISDLSTLGHISKGNIGYQGRKLKTSFVTDNSIVSGQLESALISKKNVCLEYRVFLFSPLTRHVTGFVTKPDETNRTIYDSNSLLQTQK